MSDNASRDDDLSALTFEQIVQRLEETIGQMASGDLGIEEVTDLYERAGQLHDAATQRLAGIEARLAKLTEADARE